MTVWFQWHSGIGHNVARPEGAASHVAAAGFIAWFYLCKILLPFKLCAIYPRWEVDGSNALSFLPILLLAAATVLLWSRRRRWGAGPLVAWACFVISLLPVLGFVDMAFMRLSRVADHLQYAAMPAILAPAAAILALAAARPLAGRLAAVVVGIGLAALAALTFQRAGVFSSEQRLWSDNIEKTPRSAVVWCYLGAAHLKTGALDEAIRCFDQSLELDPKSAETWSDRGAAYARAEHTEEAVRDFTQAIALKPDYAKAWYNRGSAYARTGRLEEALRDLDQAIALKPDYAEAYVNRGNVFMAARRYDEAIGDYGQAIACSPHFADAWYNRANACLAAGRPAEAIRDLDRLVALRPREARAYYKRAIARASLKQDNEALADLEGPGNWARRCRRISCAPPAPQRNRLADSLEGGPGSGIMRPCAPGRRRVGPKAAVRHPVTSHLHMKTIRSTLAAQDRSPEAPARSFLARHRTLWQALLIFIVGAAVYANSLRGVFVFDDIEGIVSNPALRRLPTLARTLEDSRPVVFLTLVINYAWSAGNPWSYHLVNAAAHVLAALALFGIVRRTLELPALAGRCGARAAPLALTIALLWMVHPLQTELVTYVIQRAESFMGLFYLLALYCLIRGHDSPHPYRWYAGAVASGLLGVGCKEVIVTLPVVALAYDRLFLAGSWRESFRRRWGLYAGLALCCGLVVCRFPFHSAGASATVGFGMKGVTPLRYALTQPGVILHYLRLSFWPWPLCLDYGWPLAGSVWDWLPALLVIGALLAVSVAGVARGRRWAFLGLAFFCILAPTSSVVPIKDAAFEHRMYLPLAAVIAGAVLAAAGCWDRAWPPADERRSGRVLVGAAILAVAGLGFLTVRRNAEYRDAVALWRQTVGCAPGNARAYGNLGAALVSREGFEDTLAGSDEALRALDKAIALQPDYAEAYVNRGIVHAAAKRYAEAIGDYDRAIAFKPDYAAAYYNRGKVHAAAHRPAEAMHDYDQALALKPDLAEAYVNRGNLRAAAKRYAEAIGDYDRAIALEPNDAGAWFSRGTACARAGDAEEALRDLDQALALKPDDAEAYYNRGNLHLDARRCAEAIRDYDQAIALRPDYADAWYNRANACASAGRPEEAVRDYTRAIELRPQDPDAYYNRAIVRSRLKQNREALEDLRRVRKLGGTVPEELLRSLGPAAQPPR